MWAQLTYESGYFDSLVEYQAGRAKFGHRYSGGGDKFFGRGLIQLTHDYNYKIIGDVIGVDLLNNRERAAEPKIAGQAACGYWEYYGLSRSFEVGGIDAVTVAVNGPQAGRETKRAREVLYHAYRLLLQTKANNVG